MKPMKNSTFNPFLPIYPSCRIDSGDCATRERGPRISTLNNILGYSRALEVKTSKEIQFIESVLN